MQKRMTTSRYNFSSLRHKAKSYIISYGQQGLFSVTTKVFHHLFFFCTGTSRSELVFNADVPGVHTLDSELPS